MAKAAGAEALLVGFMRKGKQGPLSERQADLVRMEWFAPISFALEFAVPFRELFPVPRFEIAELYLNRGVWWIALAP